MFILVSLSRSFFIYLFNCSTSYLLLYHSYCCNFSQLLYLSSILLFGLLGLIFYSSHENFFNEWKGGSLTYDYLTPGWFGPLTYDSWHRIILILINLIELFSIIIKRWKRGESDVWLSHPLDGLGPWRMTRGTESSSS
jgi:hypothetical protein